jgi:hypothetical protein
MPPKIIVSVEHVRETINNQSKHFGAKITGTYYSAKCGANKIVISHPKGGELGHIQGAMEDGVAKVETVNVDGHYRSNGLGKLLAALFYAYWEKQGATAVRLGTQDTSKGFWSYLGLSQSNSTSMASAWEMLGNISVENELKVSAPELSDYSRSKFAI